jgi:hypothetical protein
MRPLLVLALLSSAAAADGVPRALRGRTFVIAAEPEWRKTAAEAARQLGVRFRFATAIAAPRAHEVAWTLGTFGAEGRCNPALFSHQCLEVSLHTASPEAQGRGFANGPEEAFTPSVEILLRATRRAFDEWTRNASTPRRPPPSGTLLD